jgi:shikimate kinase
MNIALIGYRGTGKTTIGKILAEKLHRPFLDADALIVQRAGKTIKQIFEERGGGGEPAFRDLESQVVADLATKTGHILALGGGAILRPQNLAALKPTSFFVWLQADAKTLLARIQSDTATSANRPNLITGGGGLTEIETLLATRTPLYQAAADITLDVSTLSPQQAADRLLALLPAQFLSDSA